MRVVGFVAQRRLARHWRALIAAGVLLGLGFGLCLSSFAAARRTASAYHRILVAADAPDAAVALGQPPEQSERSLRSIKGITAQRVYAGFLGTADGVDPRPHDRAARADPRSLSPRAPDAAGRPASPRRRTRRSDRQHQCRRRGGLEVGQRLHFRFFNPASSKTAEADITIVGIGTVPAEAVADETTAVGVFVFTRAFYDAHRDLAVYAVSNVDLAPGFDARRDLAAQGRCARRRAPVGEGAGAAGRSTMRCARCSSCWSRSGVLAFGATAVAAGPGRAAQSGPRARRRRAAAHDGDDARPDPPVELATAGLVAVVAVVDRPSRDGARLAGCARRPAPRPRSCAGLRRRRCGCRDRRGGDRRDDPAPHPRVLVGATTSPAAGVAPITLVQLAARQRRDRRRSLARAPHRRPQERVACGRGDDGRGSGARPVRGVRELGDRVDRHPARYGFDADLLALNAYGDQSPSALHARLRDVVTTSSRRPDSRRVRSWSRAGPCPVSLPPA